jgi:hypothetical protein
MMSSTARPGSALGAVQAAYNVQLDRHEGKYIIPTSLLPAIRDYISPFCKPDPNGSGSPPEYTITTMQLDTPSLALHHAKEHDALARFKLRVRTYGEPGSSKVFLEVKRKVRGSISKTRTSIPFEAWCEDLMFSTKLELEFKSSKEELGFLEFVRLVRETGARPIILVRYVRESYMSIHDQYARVSMDRNLEYQPTREWDNWGQDGRWYSVDSCLSQNKQFPFSGVVLELKTLSDAPHWMIDLVKHFDLVRVGNCKYSNAIWQEALFRGTTDLPTYATELLEY